MCPTPCSCCAGIRGDLPQIPTCRVVHVVCRPLHVGVILSGELLCCHTKAVEMPYKMTADCLHALSASCTNERSGIVPNRRTPSPALQASSFKSGEVITTLQKAFIPEGQSTTLTFSSEDQVLEYIANRIVRPIWKDPVCGDGKCEMPWEFPAWGPFGCQADCGLNPNTSKIIVRLSGDFTGHPSISANTLMAQVKWNLCLNDTSRIRRGLPVLCW